MDINIIEVCVVLGTGILASTLALAFSIAFDSESRKPEKLSLPEIICIPVITFITVSSVIVVSGKHSMMDILVSTASGISFGVMLLLFYSGMTGIIKYREWEDKINFLIAMFFTSLTIAGMVGAYVAFVILLQSDNYMMVDLSAVTIALIVSVIYDLLIFGIYCYNKHNPSKGSPLIMILSLIMSTVIIANVVWMANSIHHYYKDQIVSQEYRDYTGESMTIQESIRERYPYGFYPGRHYYGIYRYNRILH